MFPNMFGLNKQSHMLFRYALNTKLANYTNSWISYMNIAKGWTKTHIKKLTYTCTTNTHIQTTFTYIYVMYTAYWAYTHLILNLIFF